jgi:hypothetical protein
MNGESKSCRKLDILPFGCGVFFTLWVELALAGLRRLDKCAVLFVKLTEHAGLRTLMNDTLAFPASASVTRPIFPGPYVRQVTLYQTLDTCGLWLGAVFSRSLSVGTIGLRHNWNGGRSGDRDGGRHGVGIGRGS